GAITSPRSTMWSSTAFEIRFCSGSWRASPNASRSQAPLQNSSTFDASNWRLSCRSPDNWFDRLRSNLCECGSNALEHRLIVIRADNGAARSGELRARAAPARGFDHLDLPLRQVVDPPPGIEVLVHQRGELFDVAALERLSSGGRDAREAAHRVQHV